MLAVPPRVMDEGEFPALTSPSLGGSNAQQKSGSFAAAHPSSNRTTTSSDAPSAASSRVLALCCAVRAVVAQAYGAVPMSEVPPVALGCIRWRQNMQFAKAQPFCGEACHDHSEDSCGEGDRADYLSRGQRKKGQPGLCGKQEKALRALHAGLEHDIAAIAQVPNAPGMTGSWGSLEG